MREDEARGEKLHTCHIIPSPLASLMQTTLRTYAVNRSISWSNLSPARKRSRQVIQPTYMHMYMYMYISSCLYIAVGRTTVSFLVITCGSNTPQRSSNYICYCLVYRFAMCSV